MTTTEPLQVLIAEGDLSDPALALGLIKKGHTCKAFECNADDPHKIGYYLHLTSSAALTGGIPAATCGRAVGSRFTGPATRKPPRAATACPAAVPPGGAGVRLVPADSFKISLCTDIPGEVERHFLSVPAGRRLHAAILMTADGCETLRRDAAHLLDQLFAARGGVGLVPAIGAYEWEMRDYVYPFMRMTMDHDRQFGGGALQGREQGREQGR